MTTKPHLSQPIDERVSSLEASVSSLVDNLNKYMARTETAIGELFRAQKQHEEESWKRQRTPWGIIIAAVAVSVTIFGAIGNSYLSPIIVHQEHLRESIESSRQLAERIRERNADQDTALARTAGALQDKLAEVETQFGWLVDAVNQDRAHRIRVEGLVWQKVYGEPMPLLHVNPIGPTKQQREQ